MGKALKWTPRELGKEEKGEGDNNGTGGAREQRRGWAKSGKVMKGEGESKGGKV